MPVVGRNENAVEQVLRAIINGTEVFYRATGEFPDTAYVSPLYLAQVREAIHGDMLEVMIYSPAPVNFNAGTVPPTPAQVYQRASLRIRAALNAQGYSENLVCVVHEGD